MDKKMIILPIREFSDLYTELVFEYNNFQKGRTCEDLKISRKTLTVWLGRLSRDNGEIRKKIKENRKKLKIKNLQDMFDIIGMPTNEERLRHLDEPLGTYYRGRKNKK